MNFAKHQQQLGMNLKRLINIFCELNLSNSNDKLRVPVFKVNPSCISVIKSPNEFYCTLKDLAEKSKERISISSLYLGTGRLEDDLVNSLSDTKSRNENLDLTILLDYNRATRETFSVGKDGHRTARSSKSALLPLVQRGANVNFYLTLKLSGWRRWIQRKPKWNELCSLHHMKLYIFDDNLVISGANLSDMYFTNRQDRYVLIRDSPQLCDYFDRLIKTVSKFSMLLQHDGQFRLHSDWKHDPRNYWHQSMFRKDAQQEISKLNEEFCLKNVENIENSDTLVFPLLQMKSLGIQDEEQFTTSLIQSCPPESRLHMATGYFNLTKSYQDILLSRRNQTPTSILMAAEEANGFFNGSGVLRYIPLVYTHYVKSFLKRMHHEKDIAIWYYNRPEWSFHAKGIWLFAPKFFMTVVGSTNFGYRSVYRDNEAQIVILSKNQQLSCAFQDEHRALIADSKPIIDSQQDLPKVPFWVSCFATFFRSYF